VVPNSSNIETPCGNHEMPLGLGPRIYCRFLKCLCRVEPLSARAVIRDLMVAKYQAHLVGILSMLLKIDAYLYPASSSN